MYQNDYFMSSDFLYEQYVPYTPTISTTIVEGGTVTVISTINGGGGGSVTGPNITISGGTTGLTFVGAGNSITLSGTLGITNGGTGATSAAAARGNLEAAKSGVNADITMFTNLASSGGWNAWTGSSDKSAHATFSGTASVGYVQAELQAVMDAVRDATRTIKALKDDLHSTAGHGLIGT